MVTQSIIIALPFPQGEGMVTQGRIMVFPFPQGEGMVTQSMKIDSPLPPGEGQGEGDQIGCVSPLVKNGRAPGGLSPRGAHAWHRTRRSAAALESLCPG